MARGGWLGQTFALAKYGDSFDGKKSGIRRSKEERKGMVETFIKRYQKSNNGDFPSLNLTRKEVGGSFYTVREIVREIIQENRVLGPPKSPPGDRSMDNLNSFLEHYPLGSISVDLHAHLVSPNDTETLPEYDFISEKALNSMCSNGLHRGNLDNDNLIEEANDPGYAELLAEREAEKHTSDEERIYLETSQLSSGEVVETTHATVSNRALEKQKNTDLSMEGGTGKQKDETKETQKHKNLEDVEVGIPVTSTVHNKYEKSSQREVLDGDSEEKNSENWELETRNNRNHNVNGSRNVETEDTCPTEEKNIENREIETENNRNNDVNASRNVESEDTYLADENTVNGANAQNLHSKSSFNSVQHPTLDERSAILNKSSDQPSGSSQNRRTNATLNRINLESWKAVSRKSSGRETHQLVKFIKSVITAFVKFWTE